jgi:hypothetical protein
MQQRWRACGRKTRLTAQARTSCCGMFPRLESELLDMGLRVRKRKFTRKCSCTITLQGLLRSMPLLSRHLTCFISSWFFGAGDDGSSGSL